MPLDQITQNDTLVEQSLARQKLFCKACHHWITAHDWAFSIKGGFEHHVFNPAGQVFHIGCFKEAPGAFAHGQASSNFTWFKGYDWQVALCQGCGTQIGWMFNTSDHVFFALILNRLVDDAALK